VRRGHPRRAGWEVGSYFKEERIMVLISCLRDLFGVVGGLVAAIVIFCLGACAVALVCAAAADLWALIRSWRSR
jgi:hypothetical protein